MRKVIKLFVQEYGYSIATKDANGFVITDISNLIVKQSRRSITYLRIVDADMLLEDDIYRLAEFIEDSILDMQRTYGNIYVYTVFITDNGLSDNIRKDIEEIQTSSDPKKVKCFEVNKRDGKLNKLFSRKPHDSQIEEDIINAVKNIDLVSNYYIDPNELMNTRIEEDNRNRYKRPNRKTIGMSKILIITNVIIFMIMTGLSYSGDLSYNELIIKYGAKVNVDILNGEVWRLITCMFLHGGFMHLLVNCLSLSNIGEPVEVIYGTKKFCIIYFISGILGSLVSFAFSMNPSVGASGAIFGLVGALLYFGLQHPKHFKEWFGNGLITMVGINIIYGFTNSGIDNFAHIGGLIGGFIVAGAVANGDRVKWYLNKLIYVVLVVVLLVGGVFVGINTEQNKFIKTITKIVQLEEDMNWIEIQELSEPLLDYNIDNKYKELAYIAVIKSCVMQGKTEKARIYNEELANINRETYREFEEIIDYYE